jgi:membrane associated rhomboid family serine protease
MVEVTQSIDGDLKSLDVCKKCQFVWFDAAEYESIPSAPAPAPRPGEAESAPLPPKAREALALWELERMNDQARAQDASPDAGWKYIPAVFGLPVEADSNPLVRRPILTWSLGAIITIASIWGFSGTTNVVEHFGFIPAEAWRYGGLTWITSFFLHGGVVHLLGNLYFLLFFGNRVEDCLGGWRWLALLGAATLAGDLTHFWAAPNSQTTCIGASGGVSGLITFYALMYPRARLSFWFGFGWRYRWFQLPVWGAFAFWALFQGIGAVEQIAGVGTVSAMAHLGGAAAGVVLWLFWRKHT